MTPRLALTTLALALTLTTPALAAPRGDWALGAALGAEGSAAVAGARTQASGRWRFADAWSVDLAGRSASLGAQDPAVDDQIYLALLAGVAWTPLTDADDGAPRVALRFAHVHHAPTESWEATPFANLAGDSSGGVVHRSGAELAVGYTTGAGWRLGDWAMNLDFEATFAALPGSDALGVSGALNVGVVFESLGG